jgi:hypothetical protein
MEAVRTSETSVHSNETTLRYISEDSKLHTRRCENLKSHKWSTVKDISLIADAEYCYLNTL